MLTDTNTYLLERWSRIDLFHCVARDIHGAATAITYQYVLAWLVVSLASSDERRLGTYRKLV